MATPISLIEESNLFRNLANEHPGVEVWEDAEFHDGGFDYFWVCSRVGGLVRNLAYVRLKARIFEKRTYDENGDDLWIPTD